MLWGAGCSRINAKRGMVFKNKCSGVQSVPELIFMDVGRSRINVRGKGLHEYIFVIFIFVELILFD